MQSTSIARLYVPQRTSDSFPEHIPSDAIHPPRFQSAQPPFVSVSSPCRSLIAASIGDQRAVRKERKKHPPQGCGALDETTPQQRLTTSQKNRTHAEFQHLFKTRSEAMRRPRINTTHWYS